MLSEHEREADENLDAWRSKPLLRDIYAGFYALIAAEIDASRQGAIVELGSGIGNLAAFFPGVFTSDVFLRPWLDVVIDGYQLPFRAQTVSHLVAFDVFHHLERPAAFLAEARRVLTAGGRLILLEPYISLTGLLVYGLLHPEPIAWRRGLDTGQEKPPPRYYAAQGNATRVFFGRESELWKDSWRVIARRRITSFAYLMSGGFSRPALYPASALPAAECGRAPARASCRSSLPP